MMIASIHETTWLSLLDAIDLSDRLVFVLGTCFINIFLFWGYNLILFLFYKFKLFKQFQSQPDAPVDTSLIWQNIRDYLITQFVGLPITTYLLFNSFVYFGMTVRGPIPTVSVVLRDLLVALILADIIGYWTHRALHHKSIYKYVHKQHHKYKVNVGE